MDDVLSPPSSNFIWRPWPNVWGGWLLTESCGSNSAKQNRNWAPGKDGLHTTTFLISPKCKWVPALVGVKTWEKPAGFILMGNEYRSFPFKAIEIGAERRAYRSSWPRKRSALDLGSLFTASVVLINHYQRLSVNWRRTKPITICQIRFTRGAKMMVIIGNFGGNDRLFCGSIMSMLHLRFTQITFLLRPDFHWLDERVARRAAVSPGTAGCHVSD